MNGPIEIAQRREANRRAPARQDRDVKVYLLVGLTIWMFIGAVAVMATNKPVDTERFKQDPPPVVYSLTQDNWNK